MFEEHYYGYTLYEYKKLIVFISMIYKNIDILIIENEEDL